jgi:hypothetical protein
MRRVQSWACLFCLSLLGFIGCAKRVPVEGLEVSREEKVVLTLDDGSKIIGRIDGGERVTYETSESTQRALVEVADETQIVLTDLVTLSEHDTKRLESSRQGHFRLYVDDAEETERLVLARDRVRAVERVVTDRSRTIRQVLFWGVGIGTALLAAKDRNF